MPNITENPLAHLRQVLRDFAAERDWDQFHTPKNLASALSVEAAELLEIFQWLKTGEATELTPEQHQHAQQEMADVLLYLVRLADRLDVDLYQAALDKMKLNGQKYPTETVRGDSRKYSEYKSS
jgi:NTP pyrophosphatase (non-canonical NTP hydrolase)